MTDYGEYLTYLMFELPCLKDEVEAPEDRAIAYATTIAVGGRNIQESMYLSYAELAGLDYDNLIIYSALVSGMGFIAVECDCDKEHCVADIINSHPAFKSGENDRDLRNDAYKNIQQSIAELTSIVYN